MDITAVRVVFRILLPRRAMSQKSFFKPQATFGAIESFWRLQIILPHSNAPKTSYNVAYSD